jgi:hypothetical protein
LNFFYLQPGREGSGEAIPEECTGNQKFWPSLLETKFLKTKTTEGEAFGGLSICNPAEKGPAKPFPKSVLVSRK